jgi:hypothetical protein
MSQATGGGADHVRRAVPVLARSPAAPRGARAALHGDVLR